MADSPTAKFFSKSGVGSATRSILMMVVSWFLNVLWLYALLALVAYTYWGVREVREKDAPYANVMVGVIVAVTLLYFNYSLLQLVLRALN